jgi:hypothetical protein
LNDNHQLTEEILFQARPILYMDQGP